MKALLLIDLQVDYCFGGALGHQGSAAVIGQANELMQQFDCVLASRDWLPADHQCFAANHPWRRPGDSILLDGHKLRLWPMHCVQESFGASFAPQLDSHQFEFVASKGLLKNTNSHSAFFDENRKRDTGLHQFLQQKGINSLHLLGLGKESAIENTAKDALAFGYDIYIDASHTSTSSF